MNKIQFQFKGGLGNQIFQYLASRYIKKKYSDISITYCFNNGLLGANRIFLLDSILKDSISLKKEYTKILPKLFSKIVDKAILISEIEKNKLKYKVNLYFDLYHECYLNYETIEKPLEKLLFDINSLIHKKEKLEVIGFWQNPIYEIDEYVNLFVDTRKFLPKKLKPNSYITIHFRRGDYFTDKWHINKFLSKFSPVSYFLLSLKLIPKEFELMPIYIISDDPCWASNFINMVSDNFLNKFEFINTNNELEDWSILRHSFINICSNSTFSYSAALLNKDNKANKLRCIVPQWFNNLKTTHEMGWLSQKGFVEL